jgi:three prime repair exonuclease-1
MTDIRTLVYFDLEATGLKSSGKPRICELSLLAVNIQDVLDLNMALIASLDNGRSEKDLIQVRNLSPRILNKLTLCVYPMATIVPLVSDLTGLDNYNLTGQSKFTKNTGNLVNSFLELLPSPVCLVAHNGNAYDFPLLKAEMEKSGTKLNSEILCVDSYVGIKEIYRKRTEVIKKEDAIMEEMKEVEELLIVKTEIDLVTDLINDGYFESEMEEGACDEVKELSKNIEFSKKENESTPIRKKNEPKIDFSRKMKPLHCSEKLRIRRKLKFLNESPPKSFSLINLHKHLLGCPPDQSHGAEADCVTLLRATAMLGSDWTDWVQQNNEQFVSCRKMWG